MLGVSGRTWNVAVCFIPIVFTLQEGREERAYSPRGEELMPLKGPYRLARGIVAFTAGGTYHYKCRSASFEVQRRISMRTISGTHCGCTRKI